MPGYHVRRLTAAGPVATHYDGPFEVEGPWLTVWPIEGKGGLPMLVAPSHAVIDVMPCDGSCAISRASTGDASGPDGG